MSLELVDGGFDLSALCVGSSQLGGWGLVVVRQGRDQPVRAGGVAAVFDGVADHPDPDRPEMLLFAGRRFHVVPRVQRTCVHLPQIPFPGLAKSVVLGGLRCDGSLHGGCELGVMFFWKESWLRPVDSRFAGDGPTTLGPVPELQVMWLGQPETFVCQATELRQTTTPGPPSWNPLRYIDFIRCRTYTIPGARVQRYA